MLPAVELENLSKRFRIGEERYLTLRDAITRAVTLPFQPKGKRTLRRSKDFVWALQDVSLEIPQGAVTGIIGANGAGKSTLLKILCKITRPTTGRGLVRGRVGSLLEVGTAFHPELTGRENVYLNGSVLGMGRKEIARKFAEIVEFAEVETFIDTPVKFFSTGMQVRLAFAVAAHLEAEIMIVDEVLAVGDYKFQKKCLEMLRDVGERGETVIMVSHNLAAIRSMCDQCFWLDEGKLRLSGGADECVDAYLHEYSTRGSLLEADVSSSARPAGLGDSLRFLNVELLPHSMHSGGFLYGEPLEMQLTFDVTEQLNDVVIGVALLSEDGTRVNQSLNIHDGSTYSDVAPGRYSLSVSIERNYLSPGFYVLDLGARSPTQGLDWVRDVVMLEVKDAKPLDAWLAEGAGAVRLPTKFGPLQKIHPPE